MIYTILWLLDSQVFCLAIFESTIKSITFAELYTAMKKITKHSKCGHHEVTRACRDLNLNLVKLVARTAIWAHPEAIAQLQSEKNNPSALWSFNCRRAKKGETRRIIEKDGCYTDDNSIANRALKAVTNHITKPGTYTVCHIYEQSCYDPKYHTSLCNLVLLPMPLAALSDHNPEVIAALKYHSYILYDFCIGKKPPKKPASYRAKDWTAPAEYNVQIQRRIRNRKPLG